MRFRKQAFNTLEECTGREFRIVITSRSSNLLLFGFADGLVALISAEWDRDGSATFEDVDSEFGHKLIRDFNAKELKAVFGKQLVEEWEKDFDEQQSRVKAEREQAERDQYEKLKLKFEPQDNPSTGRE